MWHSARFHSGTSVFPNDIANVSETDLFTLNQLVIWLNNCSKPGYLIFLLRTFVFLTPVKFVDSNLFK